MRSISADRASHHAPGMGAPGQAEEGGQSMLARSRDISRLQRPPGPHAMDFAGRLRRGIRMISAVGRQSAPAVSFLPHLPAKARLYIGPSMTDAGQMKAVLEKCFLKVCQFPDFCESKEQIEIFQPFVLFTIPTDALDSGLTHHDRWMDHRPAGSEMVFIDLFVRVSRLRMGTDRRAFIIN